MVRGKFRVSSIKSFDWSPTAKEVTLSTEYDTTIPEDQRYAQATPSGEIRMTIDNPPALEQFKLGQKVYVDFHPID